MTIKHLILSGGAYLGLYELGALRYLNNIGFYSREKLVSIHGTSIGGFLGFIVSMGLPWEDVVHYVVKRPWFKMAQVTPSSLFDMIQKKGLFDTELIAKALVPLMKAADMEEDITFGELKERTGVDLHVYAIDLNKFSLCELCANNTPDMSVVTGIRMTCALPYVFQPVLHEGKYYIDGGLLNNFPADMCLDRYEPDKNELLTMRFDIQNRTTEIGEDANLFQYSYFLYRKMIQSNREKHAYVHVENEVMLPCKEMNMNDGYHVLMDEAQREKMIMDGASFAKMFHEYKTGRERIQDSDDSVCEEEIIEENGEKCGDQEGSEETNMQCMV